MISPRAIEDLQDLVCEGLSPHLEDIIRLNALGLKLDSSKETTFANAPRIAWAGDVALHQPTCQAELWMLDVGEAVADVKTVDTFWYFACAHAKIPGFFDSLVDKDKVKKAVKDWYKSLPCTRDELHRAFRYVVYGDEQGGDVYPEETELKKENKKKKAGVDFRQLHYAELDEDFAEARTKLGLSTKELLTMTRSRLVSMLFEHKIRNGCELKQDTATAFVDYITTLRAIRERLAKEKEEKDV